MRYGRAAAPSVLCWDGDTLPIQQALHIVIIRPISHADHAEILRINALSRPAVAPLDRAELERLLSFGADHRVAETADAAVVGYMLVFAHHCAYDGEEFRYFVGQIREPFLYVDQVAIDPQHRRAGIGGQLYAALCEQARARQVKVLCCEVNTAPPNPASRAFHVRLGFTAAGEADTLDGRRVAYLIKRA